MIFEEFIKMAHSETNTLDKFELIGILFFLLICPISMYTLIWLYLNFEIIKYAVKKFAGVDVQQIVSQQKSVVKEKLDIIIQKIPKSSSITKKID